MTPAESKENAFLFLSTFPMETVRKLGSVTARSLEHARMKKPSRGKEKTGSIINHGRIKAHCCFFDCYFFSSHDTDSNFHDKTGER